MIRVFWAVVLLALPLAAADIDTSRLLKGVEEHYNRVRTLAVQFQESYSTPGRPKKIESGELLLRKPGKMRWDYRSPAGKLFLSDGKDVYFYIPADKRVEKTKLKESEDMRAPLAFLLGKLDFQREFQNFRVERLGGDYDIKASPRSDKLPYKQVEFVVTPEHQIRRMAVLGQDESLLEFNLENERLDPRLDEKLFRFEPPPGAEIVDYTKGGSD